MKAKFLFLIGAAIATPAMFAVLLIYRFLSDAFRNFCASIGFAEESVKFWSECGPVLCIVFAGAGLYVAAIFHFGADSE